MRIWQGTRQTALERPIVVYDGECPFCIRQVRRLRRWTGGVFEFTPYQEAADRFAEIDRGEFVRSVVLIELDGHAYGGAEAVYRALAHNPRMRGYQWCYESVPGFATLSETGYRFVARHRGRIGRWFPWV